MTRTGALAFVISLLLVADGALASAAEVPELDPTSVSMSVALLTGGLLVLNGRRRKR